MEMHTLKNGEIDEKTFQDFVNQHGIQQRECVCFIKDQECERYCQCGRDTASHGVSASTAANRQQSFKGDIWDSKIHTLPRTTNSFGRIDFRGFGLETSKAPYIRLCPTTKPEHVWELLMQHWRLPTPKVLISVTGGLKWANSDAKLSQFKEFFHTGLGKAANYPAWIITGGTASGMTQLLGEAVRDHNATHGNKTNTLKALGIAHWGNVANRTALDGKEKHGLFNAKYCLEDCFKTDIGENKKAEIKSKPLDYNHTHFILVDDGKEGIYMEEIDFRTRLEIFISKGFNIPLVMVVVGGEANTVEIIWNALKQDIPVVVVKGSGGAADVIGIKHSDKEGIEEFAKKHFLSNKTYDAENVSKCLSLLEDIQKKDDLLYELELGEPEKMEHKILFSLMEACKNNAALQLELAMTWNNSDIVKKWLLTQDSNKFWKDSLIYESMFTALVENKLGFVELFLRNGVCLKKFLSIETLWNLYAKVLEESSDPTAQLIRSLIRNEVQGSFLQKLKQCLCCKKTENDLLQTVGQCIAKFLKDDEMNPYKDDKYRVQISEPVRKWSAKHQSNGATTMSKRRTNYDFEELPERELFYWAIMFNRRDLARMFWTSGKDELGASLIACSMLKAMSKLATTDDLKYTLLDHANSYEHIATDVLLNAFILDQNMARKLLVRKLEHFQGRTVLSLAFANNRLKFMSHTCIQTNLDRIWMGKMDPHTPFWKIMVSFLLFVFIPFLKFETNDKQDERPQQKPEKIDDILGKKTSEDHTGQIGCALATAAMGKMRMVFQKAFNFYTAPVNVFIANTMLSHHEYSLKYRLQKWFSSYWNRFDMVIFGSFTAAVVLRFNLQGKLFRHARRTYTVTLSMFYVRFLQIFSANKHMAPKIETMRSMVKDFLILLAIFAVFLFSFGVAYQANLYPNSYPNWYLFISVIYVPYWQIFGDSYLEYMEGKYYIILSTTLLHTELKPQTGSRHYGFIGFSST